MNDLIIGAITGYKAKDVMPWLNSIKRSGFKGKTALIIYNMELDEIEKLNAAGLDYSFVIQQDADGNAIYDSPNFNICVERFGHLWYFLRKYEDDFRCVIMTDVKDVVFQTDPSKWLTISGFDNSKQVKTLVVGSENIRYRDEPWGRNNLKMSFGPLLYEELKDNPIYCAGVLAGTRKAMEEISKLTFLISRGGPQHVSGGGGPDQAALNILLNSLSKTVLFLNTNDEFVAHCGTSIPAIEAGSGAIGEEYVRLHTMTLDQIREKFINGDITFKDGQVCTAYGEPFAIVHQYDRVPEWKKVILEKYQE